MSRARHCDKTAYFCASVRGEAPGIEHNNF
jgi:hypothetical protein